MTLDEAIEELRAAWPEHGCGAGDCCLRRPGGQVLGTCRCVQRFKDMPGTARLYYALDAARRVIEAPHEPPPSLDEALAVLVDRASTQAESGTGEVARPLREAVGRLLPTMRLAAPWGGYTSRSRRLAGGVEEVARVYPPSEATGRTHWGGVVCLALGVRAPLTTSESVGAELAGREEAEAWCDEQLRAAGWVLL